MPKKNKVAKTTVSAAIQQRAPTGSQSSKSKHLYTIKPVPNPQGNRAERRAAKRKKY